MPPKKNNNKQQNVVSKQDYDSLQEKIKLLEDRVSTLEDQNGVLKIVSSNLEKEVERLRDRVDELDQYGRRSNIILRNIEVPENEEPAAIERKVKEIVEKELKLPHASNDIDKLHRIGKKKEYEGKTYQHVIVRFRSHRSRYAAYKERKKLKNGVKMSPNLTKTRLQVLDESSKLVRDIDGVDFTFANINGDLCVRLTTAVNGRHVWTFSSIQNLRTILFNKGFELPDAEDAEEDETEE